MSKLNERQVALRSGGNYTTLKDFLDRRVVKTLPWSESAVVTVSGANYALVNSTMIPSGTLSIGVGSTESGGIVAALLAGAVGTGSTNTLADSLGNVANLVKVRDATTHDPILTAGGYEVYGLIQAVSTASDGDPIGASGSENTQISFVYIASDGTITLTSVTDTVEFGRNACYVARDLPTYLVEGGGAGADAIQGATYDYYQATYTVTTAFVADEVITLSDGSGATAGASTKVGDTINLGASAAVFNADGKTQVYNNGLMQLKGSNVTWDTSGSMHFDTALDVGDEFMILQMYNS
jgi:hypothetical protein